MLYRCRLHYKDGSDAGEAHEGLSGLSFAACAGKGEEAHLSGPPLLSATFRV